MGPRGGVGLEVEDFSNSPASLDLGSCGGYGLCEIALRLLEGGARVADGDGHEYHLPPHRLESVDEWGLLGGLLFKPLVAPAVLTESDFDNDKVALLSVESARVRR